MPKRIAEHHEAPHRIVVRETAKHPAMPAHVQPPAASGAVPVMISISGKPSSHATPPHMPSQIYVPDLSGPEMPPIIVHHSAGAPLPEAVLKAVVAEQKQTPAPAPAGASGTASALPKILSVRLNPKSIQEGGESSLCVESVHTRKILVSRMGMWTYPVVCVPVHPEQTTTYIVTAISAQGKGVQRSITLTVVPTPAPSAPDPEPSVDESPSPAPEGRHHHRHHRRA